MKRQQLLLALAVTLQFCRLAGWPLQHLELYLVSDLQLGDLVRAVQEYGLTRVVRLSRRRATFRRLCHLLSVCE